jgi:septal ring factor EnvC (AmiA/AmiB activator)
MEILRLALANTPFHLLSTRSLPYTPSPMRTILAITLLLLTTSAISAQSNDPPFPLKKLNWLEKRYRNMGVERITAAEKKLTNTQSRLDKSIAAPEYPDQQKEISSQRADIATFQKELDEARQQLKTADELLAKALADKAARKQFNKELKAALQKENEQTAAENASYRSTYPYPYPSTFTIRCYSGGVGRYFWVRCTTSRY